MGFYDMYNPNNVGEYIRKKRELLLLSQQELADQLNVTISTVSKWEIGENTPKLMNLAYLSKIFGVDIDDFCNINENEEINNFEFKLIYNRNHNFNEYLKEYVLLYRIVLSKLEETLRDDNLTSNETLFNEYYELLDLSFNCAPISFIKKIDKEFNKNDFYYMDELFKIKIECKNNETKIITNESLNVTSVKEDLSKNNIKCFISKEQVCYDKNNMKAIYYILDSNYVFTFSDVINYIRQSNKLGNKIDKFDSLINAKLFDVNDLIDDNITNDTLYSYFSILTIEQIQENLKKICKNNNNNNYLTKKIYDILIYTFGQKMYEKGGI